MSFPPAIPAAPSDEREEAYLASRTSHWEVFRGLLPLVWPQDRPDLRARVVLAFGVLLIAKLVTVAVPVFYKDATDMLTAAAGTGGIGAGQGIALGIVMLILAYGTGARRHDGADAGSRRDLHRGRAERRPPAQQPHVRAPAPAVASLSPRAAHRRAVARHRAGDAWRRAHHPHGHPQRRADGARAGARVRDAALLFRLALRRHHAGDRRPLHVVHVLRVRAAHRHPARDERQRHRGQHQGHRQPSELRDGEVFRQRGAGSAPLRHLHGALRAGGDQDVPLARRAQHRPGADLHHRHDGVHAARRARHHQRRSHDRRVRDGQRPAHSALHAAQFHGHGVPRDQTRARRPRIDVRAARRATRDQGQARRQAARRRRRRDPLRQRHLRLRAPAAGRC